MVEPKVRAAVAVALASLLIVAAYLLRSGREGAGDTTGGGAAGSEGSGPRDGRGSSGPGTSRGSSGAGAGPRLHAISPRVISNQTAYPVTLWGEHLAEGLELVIGRAGSGRVRVPIQPIDARHATALLPAGVAVLPELTAVELDLALVPAGAEPAPPDAPGAPADAPHNARLLVINDVSYARPYAMELLGASIVVASPSTDQLRVLPLQPRDAPSETFAAHPAGDGPRALATYRDPAGVDWLLVAHARGELRSIRAVDLSPSPAGTASVAAPKSTALAPDLQDLTVDQAGRLAYATSHTLDAVVVFDLQRGVRRAVLPTGVNPRALALGEEGSLVVVANQLSQDVSIITLASGTERRVRPGPGAEISGGHTERYSAEVMGDSPGRAVVYDERRHVAYVATLGPGIGPNKDRMEVTQSSGVSVIDARGARFLRHVSLSGGVADALALDEERGLLYVADGATGRVVVLDADRLAAAPGTKLVSSTGSSGRAGTSPAILGELLLPRPPELAPIRPLEDFGVNGRATESLHFGAKALRLDPTGRRLYVLGRFTGTVLELDVLRARSGRLEVARRFPGWVEDTQQLRRRGEIVYYTDLGGSRMTCDTCHPEGHTGGLMFSKGGTLRIYRAPTLRAIRESPPYFTPARLPSIRRTATDVLARNRFYNPRPTREEIDALTEYTGAVAPLPNPHREAGGALPRALRLPDGASGDAVAGLALFEGKAGCANAKCHPPPAFTADQERSTRGVLHKTGTPIALRLRPELQDLDVDYGQPAPSLLGVWDIFPLFLSGAGGNEVSPEGTIVARYPFALRHVLEEPSWSAHGGGPSLSEAERNDLLAFLLTL